MRDLGFYLCALGPICQGLAYFSEGKTWLGVLMVTCGGIIVICQTLMMVLR